MIESRKENKQRLRLLYMIVMSAMAVCILWLAVLMIFRAGELQNEVEQQWTREVTVEPLRGTIKDVNGEILSATTTTQSILLYPKDIEKKGNAGEIADLLAPILNMDRQKIYEVASDTSKVEAWLKRNITDAQVEQIRALNLKGIGFFADTKRVYPYGSFLSQVLGYTNSDGRGQEGLEKAYDKYLAGYPGTILTQVDAQGRTLDGSEQTYIDAQDGYNVVLTIDAVIQSFAENAAKEALEVNQAKSVCAIVMNPQNSDILAMVNYPEADLNALDRSDLTALADISRNTAVTDAFEPGSIFKIVTMAAALDSGNATTATEYQCNGHKLVSGEKIKCWRSYNPHGTQSLTEAAENSCNPAFMEMALSMGTEQFYEYIYRFGFGTETGVDYSADGSGIVRAAKYVKDVDLARIGFGQSIAVTPLQMINAVSAAINGGVRYTPRLVSHTEDSKGNVVEEFAREEGVRVISEETSATLREILQSVVDNGSGKNAQIAGYAVGGKTGTAQVYENGAIAQGKNISSFIGFAPADDPQYIVLFIVREPSVPVTFGSVVAAPYAKDILEKCLKYGGVQPTREVESDLVTVPDIVGMDKEEAQVLLQKQGLKFKMNGEGKVAAQSPAMTTEVAKGTVVDGYGAEQGAVAESTVTVPDVRGMTVYQAYQALSEAGLKVQIDGSTDSDEVSSQTPAANKKAAYGDTVTIKCN